MKITLSVLLLIPVALPGQSRDTARVAPVTVTATRAALPGSAQPVAVTVLQGDDLRARGITTVGEALRDVTSAYVAQTGSQGGITALFLRGGESKYVKVLVDGVPANDPGGAYDFASLTTDNVERIEVVRGPASVVHGADAVTGVVHVITRRGAATPGGELSLRAGTGRRAQAGADATRTLALEAATSGVAGRADYALSLSRHASTGLYPSNNDYHNNVLSARVHLLPQPGTELRLALRYNDYRYDYPTNGGGTVVDSNAYRTEDRAVIGVELERRLGTVTSAVLAIGSSVNEGGTDDQMDAPGGSSYVAQDKVRRRGAELRLQATPAAGTFTVGARIERQDQRSQFQSQSSFGPYASNFRADRRSTGAYAEAVVTPFAGVTATVGARMDDNEQFGRFGTGRGGISWRPLAGTRLRATVGNAFREPSFFENYASGFVTGNPGLRPERSVGWDAGVEQDALNGRVHVAATAFAHRFENMIDYEPTGAACGYSYCNVAAAVSRGVEAEARARIHRDLWAAAGATFLRTRVEDPGYDNSSAGLYRAGERLIRRPDRTVTADLSYRGRGPVSATARLLAVGIRHDRDYTAFPAAPVVLPSYERLDLSAEYRLGSGRRERTLSLRVENATDERYENVYNFLTPRRTMSLGIRSAW